MDHSSLPTAAAPSSAHPSFGGLRPADLSIRIAEAIECGATAALAINTEDIRDLTSGRPLMSAPLTVATKRVSALIGDLRAVESSDLLSEMGASLEQAAARLNEASALVSALSGDAAVRAIQAAQVWLQSAAMDVRWEVELVQAALEFEVAEENRRAQNLFTASRSWPMPVFRPAPDMPRDAGNTTVGVILGIVSLIVVVLFCIALGGKADARAVPPEPVKAQPASPRPQTNPACEDPLQVHVKARTTEPDEYGNHYLNVYLQEQYGDPRWVDRPGHRVSRSKPGYMEYGLGRLIGTGVSKTSRVTAVACLDPRRVDGHGRNGAIELILVDPIDDDHSRANGDPVKHAAVRVAFGAAGWKRVSK